MFGKRQPEGNYQRNADKTRYRCSAGLRAAAGTAVAVVGARASRALGGRDVGRALFKSADDVGAALSHHANDVGVAAISTSDDMATPTARHADESITLPEVSLRVAEEAPPRADVEAVRHASRDAEEE
jgi:hypothetical protein